MRILALTTALGLLMTPAHANDATVADGIAGMIAYDTACESVPRVFMKMLEDVVVTLPTAAIEAANEKMLASYRAAGPARWCAAMKPVMQNAMRNVR
jgi:hypothetical protein